MIFWRSLGAVLLLAAGLARPVAAQKTGETSMTVSEFHGEDVFRDSAHIDPQNAQSAINVITEHGYVEKRSGAVIAATFSGPIENLAEFVKQAGTRFLVGHVGNSLYDTDLGFVPVAIATVANNSQVDFVVAYNKIIAVDGTNEIEYNGASTTTGAGFPGCKFVEFYLNRIWCANILAETQGAVRISSVGTSGYWTIPPSPSLVPDAPNEFYIQRDDGYPITCFKATPWGMVVGKRRSMWIIKGTDNTNWYIRNIDPAIGCSDDRSMQMADGVLKWLGTDDVYSWDGGNPVKMESQQIEPVVKTARQAIAQSQSWALDSESDWQSGVLAFDPGAPMSATELPGSVIPSSFTLTESTITLLSDPRVIFGLMSDLPGKFSTTLSTNTGWVSNFTSGSLATSTPTFTGSGCSVVSSSIAATSSGLCCARATPTAGDWSFQLQSVVGTSNPGIFYPFTDSSGNNGSGGDIGNGYAIQLTPGFTSRINRVDLGSVTQIASSTGTSLTAGTVIKISRDSVGNWIVYANGSRFMAAYDNTYSTTVATCINSMTISSITTPILFSSGTYLSTAFNTTLSTPIWGGFNVSYSSIVFSTVNFYTQTSSDGVSWSALQAATAAVQVQSPNFKWIRYESTFAMDSKSSATPIYLLSPGTSVFFTNYIVATTSGYYYSPVHFVGSDISQWNNFDVTQTLPAGATTTFSVRQATYSFSPIDTTISWSTQSPGVAINLSISTPTFVQWKVLFNPINADALISDDLTRINWVSGNASGNVASAFLNHRYYLCVAISSNVNDTCLVQQRTHDWVIFTGQNLSSLTLYNSDIMGGSANADGKAWREFQDGVYNDDGQPINSSWTSPDYLFQDPVSKKTVNEIWIDAQPSTTTILNVGYAVDKSTSYNVRTLDLGTSSTHIDKRVPITNGNALGKYFKLQIQNGQPNYFRVNAFTLYLVTDPRLD